MGTYPQNTLKAPLTDAIIIAVAKLIDDSQLEKKREPTHSDIDFIISNANCSLGDPKTQGQTVGKYKRLRNALRWAFENDYEAGEKLIASVIALIKGRGGFRSTSPNYVGSEAIENAISVFRRESFVLTQDGELRPLILENLSGSQMTDALQAYVHRAKQGVEDAALLIGTGKDLLEATAAHILFERYGTYPKDANFPTLLGQAFVTTGLATPEDRPTSGEPAQKKVERAMFELACSINAMRNKEGTGHGRPWLPNITKEEAKIAIQFIGNISEWMLNAYKKR